jgi:hypothetical protein
LNINVDWGQWFTPVTQEAEIRRIMVRSKPWQIVHETLSKKKCFHTQTGAGEVDQGVDPELKPQYQKKSEVT